MTELSTPSNSQFPWSESGLVLLANIQRSIERNGGEDTMLDKALYELEDEKYKRDEALLTATIKKMHQKMYIGEIADILGVTKLRVSEIIRTFKKY